MSQHVLGWTCVDTTTSHMPYPINPIPAPNNMSNPNRSWQALGTHRFVYALRAEHIARGCDRGFNRLSLTNAAHTLSGVRHSGHMERRTGL
jgi:hypothetical protein